MSKVLTARSVSPLVGFLAALALVAAALLAGFLTTSGHSVAGSVWNKKPPASAGSVWNKGHVVAGSVWNKTPIRSDGSVWN
jgi:archaellum component FlaG (FlaF/FlaG flagellin family)